jgi:hypothetical protein
MSIEKPNDLNGNRTRDLPTCSIVPQNYANACPQLCIYIYIYMTSLSSYFLSGPESKNDCAGEKQKQITALLFIFCQISHPCRGPIREHYKVLGNSLLPEFSSGCYGATDLFLFFIILMRFECTFLILSKLHDQSVTALTFIPRYCYERTFQPITSRLRGLRGFLLISVLDVKRNITCG